MRNAIRTKNADEPTNVSYFYNLISFSGCSNSSGADTEYRIHGGTQAIPIKIANKLIKNAQSSKASEATLKSSTWTTEIQLNTMVRKIKRRQLDHKNNNNNTTIQY